MTFDSGTVNKEKATPCWKPQKNLDSPNRALPYGGVPPPSIVGGLAFPSPAAACSVLVRPATFCLHVRACLLSCLVWPAFSAWCPFRRREAALPLFGQCRSSLAFSSAPTSGAATMGVVVTPTPRLVGSSVGVRPHTPLLSPRLFADPSTEVLLIAGPAGVCRRSCRSWLDCPPLSLLV